MNHLSHDPQCRYTEKHRPQLHYSPARNWMNDPNGMVYYNGVYHLFYQYNPADKVWDDMHWGHAVSSDLVHWQEKPIALFSERGEHGLGHIFSGSAVVDWNNSTQLGDGDTPPFVALFTHSSDSGVQVQSLAYSNDLGDTWAMYEHNPVIANHGEPDFRDPKVFWDKRTEQWVMVLAANKVIQFYHSKNLINWDFLCDFGAQYSEADGVWECPDLFQLTVNGSEQTKWVLLVSLNPGGPNGGSGTRYFIGDFDGQNFTSDHSEVLWLDYGPDNYAGVTWSDTEQAHDRKILVAWMSNWQYAGDVPTDPWRGAMTLPRELSLVQTDVGLRLASPPVRELESLRKGSSMIVTDVKVSESSSFITRPAMGEAIELELSLNNSVNTHEHFCLRLFNDHHEQLLIDVNISSNEVRLNRVNAAHDLHHENGFAAELTASLVLNKHGDRSLRLIKDSSSVELVTGQGLAIFSALYYVDRPLDQVQIMSIDGSKLNFRQLAIKELSSIWQDNITINNEATPL